MSALIPPQAAPSWDTTPEKVIKDTKEYIRQSKEMYDSIASVEDPTIENVLEKHAEFYNTHDGISNQLTFLQHVSADKGLRDASTEAEKLISDYSIEAGLREDVFKVFQKLHAKYKDASDLNPETKRYLEKTLTEYRRNGLALSKEDREKAKKLQLKLSDNSVSFSKNLGENTEHVLFTKEELDGVPQDVIDQFEKQEDGKLKMTFKYPDLFPVMKYAKNPETRKRAFIGDSNKCSQNEELLFDSIKLRKEYAELLGYKTFSDYVLEERMAKSTETVKSFLKDLRDRLTPLGIKERENLLNLKKQDYEARGLEFDNEYHVWDHKFYDTLYLEREYKVDQQKIAEYFPMTPTINKMFGFFERLLNLKFVEVTDESEKKVWHEDVKQFAVWKLDDPEAPEFAGWLYMDLHPRDGKYGHAANFGAFPGFTSITTGKRNYPVTSLVCNFSKPSKEKPSLLKHDEVTTFFHELGHGIHDLMGKTQYAKFHGTSVSWDFVEAPSQMLEYWTWSPNELKKLSEHYQTGEQIDDELVESLIKTKHVNGGLFNLRQIHFGTFDITVHSTSDLKSLDIKKLWSDLRREISLVTDDGITNKGYNSFAHIMGGYQAGYYGYLWSQVFAADIYYSKFKQDPMNTANGVKYRDLILARGGSREEMDNLKELLGREPNNEAFSRELGLA